MSLREFLAELRHRGVLKVATVYLASGVVVLEAAGGQYLVRGGAQMVIEGDWKPTRLVIFEFPSQAAAQSFYVSPAYQSLKALRQEASSANIVGVEGV